MFKHHPKLKKLATTNGKIDGRKLRSSAFISELSKIVTEQLLQGKNPKHLGYKN